MRIPPVYRSPPPRLYYARIPISLRRTPPKRLAVPGEARLCADGFFSPTPGFPGPTRPRSSAALQVRWKLIRSLSVPRRRVIITILTPYGYHAVNEGRVTAYSGRNVTWRPRPGEKQILRPIVTDPLTMERANPKYTFRAGRSHLLRDCTRPRDPSDRSGA